MAFSRCASSCWLRRDGHKPSPAPPRRRHSLLNTALSVMTIRNAPQESRYKGLSSIGDHAQLLERVLRKLTTGQMPPAGMPRPNAARMAELSKWLEASLDAEAAGHPN